MNKKYFVFGDKKDISKDTLLQIEKESQDILRYGDKTTDEIVKSKLEEEDNLIHTEGRIVVKLDIKNKDSHTFEGGLTIKRERNFNNFNRRETQPVNCIVISGYDIPKGAELLVDHNAFHETNRINDYKNTFENEESDRVRYFSIETYECYAWRMGVEEWRPIPPFEFAMRVIKPYNGILQGIEPTVLKDTLYVTSGELKGNVVRTLIGCDYQIVFQTEHGVEGSLIVFRPFGDEKRKMEEEAICILHNETEQVNSGELLIGYSIKDAKQISEYAN